MGLKLGVSTRSGVKALDLNRPFACDSKLQTGDYHQLRNQWNDDGYCNLDFYFKPNILIVNFLLQMFLSGVEQIHDTVTEAVDSGSEDRSLM